MVLVSNSGSCPTGNVSGGLHDHIHCTLPDLVWPDPLLGTSITQNKPKWYEALWLPNLSGPILQYLLSFERAARPTKL